MIRIERVLAVAFGLFVVVGGCGETDGSSGSGLGGQPPDGDDGGDDADGGGDDGGDDGTGGGDSGDDGTGGDDGADDGGEDTGDGGAFINEPDGGGTDAECDVYSQDCPEGEKCMPWANDGGNFWNATKCSPLDPNPVQPGDTCLVEGSGVSGVDNCDKGAMCWNVDPETNQGTCIGLCFGDPTTPTCEDPSTICVIFNDGMLPVCLHTCDPLLSDCGEREVCRPDYSNDLFVCSNDASGEEGQYQDPCEFGNACDPGLYCANVEDVPGCVGATGCCSEFCDLSDPNASQLCSGVGQGQECIPWYASGNEPPGLENVGFCGIPE
jgi:hypothetical protein